MSFTTGNNSIDSLVYGSWNSTAGTSATLTYSFLTQLPSDATSEDRTGFRAMTTAQQAAVRDALAKWSSVANVTFVETSANGGNLQFGTNTQDGSSAYAYLPEPGIDALQMYVNNQSSYNSVFTPGTYGPSVLIHEIGHLLGLKHPGNYDSGGATVNGPFLPASTDNGDYTQMSYNEPTTYTINGKFATTAMLYDIQAIQYLYGANMSYHAGNDVYSFTSSNAPLCIWDGGGVNTFDFSACTRATIIDLNAGTFSETAPGLNNISIAYGVTITTAIAGSGGSTIHANALGNTLTGGAGNDHFHEGAGNDTIVGGGGTDTVIFSHSYASYQVQRSGDTVTVVGDGTDILSGIETLQFSDRVISAADIASLLLQTGTAGNDVLQNAAAAEQIDGGAGLDTLVYGGVRSGFTVVATGSGFNVQDKASGVVDQLVNVERLQFGDVSVALDVDGTPGEVYRLYEAAFNRMPDAGGVGYWIRSMDMGSSLSNVALAFSQSAEYTQVYGNLDNAAFVKQLYVNALDRQFDAGGLQYWTDVLAHGASRGDVMVGFSESVENQAKLAGVIENGIDYVPFG